jgi:hypothetical protein
MAVRLCKRMSNLYITLQAQPAMQSLNLLEALSELASSSWSGFPRLASPALSHACTPDPPIPNRLGHQTLTPPASPVIRIPENWTYLGIDVGMRVTVQLYCLVLSAFDVRMHTASQVVPTGS